MYLSHNLRITFWKTISRYTMQNVQTVKYIIVIVALFKVKNRKKYVTGKVVKQTMVHL